LYERLSAGLESHAWRTCGCLAIVGLLLDVIAVAIGIDKAEVTIKSKVVQVGYFAHYQMWVWHGIVVPLMIIACGQFYSLKKDAESKFRELCSADLTGRFAKNAKCASWQFTILCSLFVCLYSWLMYTQYKRNDTGWTQIHWNHSAYSFVQDNPLLHWEPVFIVAVFAWAEISIALLIHFFVSFLEFLGNTIPLYPNPKGNESNRVCFDCHAKDGHYGIGAAVKAYESMQWITLGLMLLPLLHYAGNSGGGRGDGATACLIYFCCFLVPTIFVGTPVLLVVDNVNKWREQQDLTLKEKQSLFPEYSNATRCMIASTLSAVIVLSQGLTTLNLILGIAAGALAWTDKLVQKKM
jgi:hypothetical protein